MSFVDPANAGNVGPTVAAGALPLNFSPDRNGFMGGLQLGYNHHIHPNWVLGIEADFSLTDWNGTQTKQTNLLPAFLPLATGVDNNTNWFGTLRGRLGFAHDRWLVYGTGGGAYAQTYYRYSQSNVFGGGTLNFSQSEVSTDFGWVVGGGVEYGFGNWTFRAEYLHYDLGNHSYLVRLPGTPASSFTPVFENTGDLVRVALNYRFTR